MAATGPRTNHQSRIDWWRKRVSAARPLCTFLAADMIGNSVCLRVKRGKPGRYSANWLYESEGKTELQILRKTSDRELLNNKA
jgi:hypothetical protein